MGPQVTLLGFFADLTHKGPHLQNNYPAERQVEGERHGALCRGGGVGTVGSEEGVAVPHRGDLASINAVAPRTIRQRTTKTKYLHTTPYELKIS